MTPLDSYKSNRRHFLASGAFSICSTALTWLLQQDSVLGNPPKPQLEPLHFNLKPKQPQHAPSANAMISLWMQGGPSHIDLFDPKPELTKRDGQAYPGDIKYDNAAQASATMLGSPWKFQKHGQCGTELSELLPYLSEIVDDICLIRSIRTGVNNHGQSIRALNTGRIIGGQPGLGSWLTYGLGTESQDLPAYLALTDPGQLPVLGVENWSNGYLPSLYQGTVIRPREPRIRNLTPPIRLQGQAQQRYLSFLEHLNRRHLAQRPGEHTLEARIASYELAAKMQTAAKEALDLNQETAATKKMYGLEDKATREYGTRCLIARRRIYGSQIYSIFIADSNLVSTAISSSAYCSAILLMTVASIPI